MESVGKDVEEVWRGSDSGVNLQELPEEGVDVRV